MRRLIFLHHLVFPLLFTLSSQQQLTLKDFLHLHHSGGVSLPLSVVSGVFSEGMRRRREISAVEILSTVLACVHASCFKSMKFPVRSDSLFFPHASVLEMITEKVCLKVCMYFIFKFRLTQTEDVTWWKTPDVFYFSDLHVRESVVL